MKSKLLPFILGFAALSVSASAAFYSVTGLGKLFTGASVEVMIMAGALEFSKIVAASFLYQYWDKLNKVIKGYLSTAVVVLILITSMGIYGFLTSAYQESTLALESKNTQTEYYQDKVNMFEESLERLNVQENRIETTITNLSSAKATQIQVRDTSSSTGFRETVSTAELKLAQKRLDVEEKRLQEVQKSKQPLQDSIQKYKTKILESKQDTSLSSELGPLIYLSQISGREMDTVINILILVIVLVFDPLAVTLVVATNIAYNQAFKQPKEEEAKVTPSPGFGDPQDTRHFTEAVEKTEQDSTSTEEEKEEKKQEKDIPKKQVREPEKEKVLNETKKEVEVLDTETGIRRWKSKKAYQPTVDKTTKPPRKDDDLRIVYND